MNHLLNLEHVRSVKHHVHFLLFGLPDLSDPISYPEIVMALRQLAEDYEAIAAAKNHPTTIAA